MFLCSIVFELELVIIKDKLNAEFSKTFQQISSIFPNLLVERFYDFPCGVILMKLFISCDIWCNLAKFYTPVKSCGQIIEFCIYNFIHFC